jgi:NAD(P)H-hydrate epimerase
MDTAVTTLTAAVFKAALQARPRDSHKGDFGHLLIIGGSRGKSGAPALAGLAALRAGAGLVTVAAPVNLLPQITRHAPELMTLPLPESQGNVSRTGVETLGPLLGQFDAVAAGMGLGTGPGAVELIASLGSSLNVPLLLDADALNLYAGRAAELAKMKPPLVITPHTGEAARLLDVSLQEARMKRSARATELSRLTSATVVYKGHHSLIATADGGVALVPTGNPGMAKAGSGDALAGIIGALLARGLDAKTAAGFGAYWHGLAGDLAAQELTEECMLPTDLIRFLPDALMKMREEMGNT